MIYQMHKSMSRVPLSDSMRANVEKGSAAYTRKFREYVHDVNINFQRHKNFILDDVDITK
jgi:hypothetical protein